MKLVSNRHSDYTIVYSKDCGEATRYAANELQKYIYSSTQCCLGVMCDKCERRGKEIHIGNSRGKDYSEYFKTEDYELSSEGSVIKLLENDDIIIVGPTQRANLYGVYYFLEFIINLRCYHKNEIYYDYPLKDIEFNELDLRKDFPFEYREVYFTDAFDGVFASMNMLNSNLANISNKLGGKTKWYNFHHSFGDIISTDEYYDKHPEYFSLIDGVRVKEHTELCLSNASVVRIAIQKVKGWLDKNPDCKVISVAQDEWMGHFTRMACECEKCKEIDDKYGSQAASIIVFVNKIAKALEKDYPDVLIHTFAYQYSRKPPKKIKPHKNVIIRLCNIECSWGSSIIDGAKENKNGRNSMFLEDLKGWSKLTKRLYIWDYAVNYRNYLLPFPCLKSMYDNIMTYKKYGVKGILMEGNFSNGGKGYFDELKSYVCSRLLTSDENPLEVLVKDFCDHYYKGVSNWIYDYVMLFEDAVAGHELWLYDDADNPMFTDNLKEKARILIDKALMVATKKSDVVLYDRVLAVSLSLRYLEISSLPVEDKTRNNLINKFEDDVRRLGITELFERTDLDYSFNVLRNSQYCKDRPEWYSLYYIMK